MEKMIPSISAVVIAKNEQEQISDCLQALSWASEVIVVDNHSTDDTALLARKHGATVIACKSTDFSGVRNVGKMESRGDWILYVDADERVTNELVEEIRQVLARFNSKRDPHAYVIKRRNFYLGHHEWPYQDGMVRLFWRKSLVSWKGKLHESPVVKGAIGKLRMPLLHYSHRSVSKMVTKTNEWSGVEAKLRFDTHHPAVVWWRLLRVMLTGFWDSYVKQQGYRLGTVGFIESIYQSFSMFVTYAKLWEMQVIAKGMK